MHSIGIYGCFLLLFRHLLCKCNGSFAGIAKVFYAFPMSTANLHSSREVRCVLLEERLSMGVTNYHIGPHRTPLVHYEAPRNLPQQ